MPKRHAARRANVKRSARKRAGSRRPGKRSGTVVKASARKRARRSRRAAKRPARPAAANRQARATTKPLGPPSRAGKGARTKLPHLGRVRRTLEEIVPTPPSSLNLDRHGSAARTGRAEIEEALKEHHGITPAITGGDVDANWQQAYFSGDEAPGGDNPTPDQEVVDDIGKAIGVQYEDNEELKSSDKVVERDKHRWELDPASAEDYKERK